MGNTMQKTIFLLFTIFVCFGLADNECSYLASDGSFYDLSALKEASDFITSDPSSSSIFYFSICRNAYTCADSAACAKTPLGEETILGSVEEQSFSEKHVKDGEGISLVYKGGVDCEGVEDAADFFITLNCDESVEYLVADFESKCSESRAIIRSKYACPQIVAGDPGIPGRRSQEVVEETEEDFVDGDLQLVYVTGAIASAIIGSVLVAVVAVVIVVLRKKPSEDAEGNSEDYAPLTHDALDI